ncbi:MAG: RNA methyltransferase [Caldilineaceae bacterium]|nr:RNA methyltransferase [Caldilineaceae bacterium]
MVTEISSLQNNRIKELSKLSKRRVRDARRMTLVEGARESLRCLDQGVTPIEVYLCPALLTDEEGRVAAARLEVLAQTHRTRLFHVTEEVFARIAYRESGGLLLVIPYGETGLAHLPAPAVPLYAVIEGVEKPGNLGAILRTADAAGVDGLIVSQTRARPATDLYNPNVVRASLGALFTVPVAEASTAAVIDWLAERQIPLIAATPDGTVRYTDAALVGPVAVALGSEAFGLSEELLAAAQQRVVIPMFGVMDSLNLATSAALLMYEAVRQRGDRE